MGEILMAHGGPNLNKWRNKLVSVDKKLDFAITMLKQVLLSLRKLHSLGYSHGDLKPGNICAKMSKTGEYKFILIDFGLSAKLAQLGYNYSSKIFRGNMLFASIQHILRSRVSQLDDLYSLLCVAHYFIIGTLPWIDYIEKFHSKVNQCPQNNLYRVDRYIKLRVKK